MSRTKLSHAHGSMQLCCFCRYYVRSTLRGFVNIGECEYFAGSDELIKLPQWVRKADRTVWGEQDGHDCSRWDPA